MGVGRVGNSAGAANILGLSHRASQGTKTPRPAYVLSLSLSTPSPYPPSFSNTPVCYVALPDIQVSVNLAPSLVRELD